MALGVFLGLQAESWYSDQSDDAEAAQYAKRLVQDYTEILEKFERLDEEVDRDLQAIEQLEGYARGEVLSDDDGKAIIDDIANYLVPPKRAATYIELLQSNKLRLFQDSKITRALIDCDNQVASIIELSSARRNIVLDYSTIINTLYLDSLRMPFQEAFALAEDQGLEFQRTRDLIRLILAANQIEYQRAGTCAADVIISLET